VLSDPWIYESPRMFTHEDDVFLVARTDFNGPFDRGYKWLPFAVQKERNLGTATRLCIDLVCLSIPCAVLLSFPFRFALLKLQHALIACLRFLPW
jgi:hypothetical protein